MGICESLVSVSAIYLLFRLRQSGFSGSETTLVICTINSIEVRSAHLADTCNSWCS